MIPPEGITVQMSLGDTGSFGLGGMSATPDFFDATVLPEPVTAPILGISFLALLIIARRRTPGG